jgi:predicted Zn-dependent protease
MKSRLLLAGFAKTVLVHRHAFVPSAAATARIGASARMPASFEEAYGSPEAEALLAAAVQRLWLPRGARVRPGVLEGLVDRCSSRGGLRALETAARGLGFPARLWLALALMRRVDLPAARRVLDELAAGRPDWVWPRLVRSELERVDIRYEEALRDLDAAERLEPGNAWVHAFRARVLFQSDPGPSAAAAMERAVALAPREGWLRAWRADARRKRGDLAGAEADLSAALRLEPAYDRSYLWAGKVLRARGKPAQADRILTRGLRSFPRF